MTAAKQKEPAPRKSTPGHGGARAGSGRKPGPYTEQQKKSYSDLAEAKAKRETYKADLAELEYEQAVGKLLPADQVLERWQGILANVRAKLLSLPSHLAATCANATHDQVEEKAAELVREALEELSENG